MFTDPTKSPKSIEPTQPPYLSPYEPASPYRESTQVGSHNPYELPQSYYGDVPPIPPPPPSTQRGQKGFVLVLASAFCLALVLVGGVLFVVLKSNQQQQVSPTKATTTSLTASTGTLPTPTQTLSRPTSTPNPNYTAFDILSDFNSAGIHPKFVEHNRTIWSWSGDTYYVSVGASSSVNFADDSACTGPCSPANLGVWVYSTTGNAIQAYNDVLNDEKQPNGSIPMMGIPPEVLHGRCLLLGADAQSIYGQVVMQYCV